MALSSATQWWIAAAVLVAFELGSGTFYLLMLACGAAAGGLGAQLGLEPAWQAIAAAAVGGGLVAVLHFLRRRRPAAPPPSADPNLNLDIGSAVQVETWDGQGTARVRYRGSDWEARFGGPGVPAPGAHRIVAIDGSTLVLQPDASAHPHP